MEVIFLDYTKISINLVSAIISLLFILIFSIFFNNTNLEFYITNLREEICVNKIEEEFKIENDDEWKIIIPKINLEANIAEGTTKEILDQYVGHFEETSKLNGNIGLAAHNRGYNVNYFSNIKNLEVGDEIIYKYSNKIQKYMVISKNEIKDTNWSYLENTEENKITLITCLEDMPEYRRCIVGIEMEE